MFRLRHLFTAALAVAVLSGLVGVAGRADAQTNLLVNGSLERPYYGQGAATRTAPNGWSLWVGAGAPEAFPHSDKVQVIDGEVSWNIKQGYTAFTAAGYQRVTGLTAGTRLNASAYGWVYTCNNTETSCVIADPPYRRSDTAAGASLRVGVDPTGGTDPNSANVVWSGGTAPYDQWAQMSVVVEAQGDAVTMFLWASQQQGLALNNVYWDNAVLVNTDEALTAGAEGAAAAAPPLAEVPFVVPQGVRPDGSIMHVIQEGDTLSSIAYAYSVDYGVTLESIAELNEDITPNTRFLTPGDELFILPPGSVDPTTGRVLSDSERDSATPVTAPSGSSGTGSRTGSGQSATPVPTITPRGQSAPSGSTSGGSTAASPTPRYSRSTPVGMVPSPTPTTRAAATEDVERAQIAAVDEDETEPASRAATELVSDTQRREIEPTAVPDVTEEAEDAAVATRATVTATPQAVAAARDLGATSGQLCVTVFEDANQNGRRDSGESLLAGADVVVAGAGTSERVLPVAAGNDPLCEELPAGQYTVAARVPEGYGLTTSGQVMVSLAKGGQVTWDFGGLEGYTAPQVAAVDDDAADEAEDADAPAPGAVAPMVNVGLDRDDEATDRSALDDLWDNSGLIVLGFAGVIVLGSAGALVVMRRVTH